MTRQYTGSFIHRYNERAPHRFTLYKMTKQSLEENTKDVQFHLFPLNSEFRFRVRRTQRLFRITNKYLIIFYTRPPTVIYFNVICTTKRIIYLHQKKFCRCIAHGVGFSQYRGISRCPYSISFYIYSLKKYFISLYGKCPYLLRNRFNIIKTFE